MTKKYAGVFVAAQIKKNSVVEPPPFTRLRVFLVQRLQPLLQIQKLSLKFNKLI